MEIVFYDFVSQWWSWEDVNDSTSICGTNALALLLVLISWFTIWVCLHDENDDVRGFKCISCNFTTLVVVFLGCELQEHIFLSTTFSCMDVWWISQHIIAYFLLPCWCLLMFPTFVGGEESSNYVSCLGCNKSPYSLYFYHTL